MSRSIWRPITSPLLQIDAHIQKLAQLTADNPDQQFECRSAAPPGAAEAQGTGQHHGTLSSLAMSAAARALVLTNRGLFTMENIRALVDEMQQEEAALDAIRTAGLSPQHSRHRCLYLPGERSGWRWV